MPIAPVTDLGQALLTSFAAALAVFFAAIPKIIGFAIVLIIGWMIASAVAAVVTKLLRSVRFNELANRAGLSDFVTRMGVRMDASAFVANVVKWFIRLVALVVAFDALGLPAVSQVLQGFLAWIPNLIVALVVLVIGGLAANALSKLVRGAASESELGDPELLSTVARIAVWALAIVVAVNQIGIATTLVNTLFMAFVGAFALAAGLAFGLGGRETAGKIVEQWYAQSQQTAAKAKRSLKSQEEEPEKVGAGGNGKAHASS